MQKLPARRNGRLRLHNLLPRAPKKNKIGLLQQQKNLAISKVHLNEKLYRRRIQKQQNVVVWWAARVVMELHRRPPSPPPKPPPAAAI